MHSYAASLSIKTCIDKTNNIFKLTSYLNSKTKAIYLNPLISYESKLRIQVTSPWIFF